MRDRLLVALLALGFAALVTSHLSLVFGLAQRSPKARALLAFVIPPLAPYWGMREHMGARAVMWIASAVIYATAWILALN